MIINKMTNIKFKSNILIKYLSIFYWPLFTIFIIIGFVITLSPYLSFGDKGYFYYSLKPYFLQLFGSKESLWVFLAFFIIPLQEFNRIIKEKNSINNAIENARIGLFNELVHNMDSIFSSNVDKPIDSFWYEQIKNNTQLNIIDISAHKWQDFSNLYKEIIYYRNLVSTYFLNRQIDVAEYQFIVQNRYARFLGWKTGLDDLEGDTPFHKKIGKNVLSEMYDSKKDELVQKLLARVNELFD